jgi:predicted transcriptional regulator
MDDDANDDANDDQRRAADALRRDGMTRNQIARSLGVSTWRVTELLAGLPPVRPELRVRAKDDLKDQARTLRQAGRTMPEIAEELGVSRSSVSLWTSDLPTPPRRPDDHARVAAARRAQWNAFLAERERERSEVKEAAGGGRPADAAGALADRRGAVVSLGGSRIEYQRTEGA